MQIVFVKKIQDEKTLFATTKVIYVFKAVVGTYSVDHGRGRKVQKPGRLQSPA
jgi:hypothetical protein